MDCPRCGCPDYRPVLDGVMVADAARERWLYVLYQCEGCKHVWAA